MKFTAKLLYGSAREKRKAHQKTSGFLLLLLRFVLRKQVHVQQLHQPEAKLPSDKCLFLSAPGDNSFWKAPELWGTKHQRTTPLLPLHVMNYTHPVAGYVSVPTVAILLSPWQIQQLKCWFDAWHFNIATLPETWPTLAVVFKVSKRLLIVWPKSMFSRMAMFFLFLL